MTLNDVTGLLVYAGFLLRLRPDTVGVFLLPIRFPDLYEREPLPTLALLAAVWGAVGALSAFGNRTISLSPFGIPPEVEVVSGAAVSAPLVEEATERIALQVVLVFTCLAARRGSGGA